MRRALAATALIALAATAAPAVPPAHASEPGPVGPGPEHDYRLHCSGCHGPDGRGAPGTVPSLHGLGPLLTVEGGRAYAVGVPGVAQAPVDDARLARLLNWAFSRFSKVRPEPPFTADEVASLRRVPIRDTRAARARIDARLAAAPTR